MRTTRRTPIALVLAGLAAFALLLGACSDSGDDEADDTTTTTAAEDTGADFVAEVDALCEANDEVTDQLDEDLTATLEDLGAALEEGDEDAAAAAADEAVEIFEQAFDANQEIVADMEALGVPDEHRETIDAVSELLDEQNAAIEEAAGALLDRDYDRYVEIGEELADMASENEERSQELADALGTEHCGPDADDEDGDAEDEGSGGSSSDETETFDPDNG
jgi:hypothetical protein